MAQLRRGERALVTGASSGIGEAFADALASRGIGLLLVARREDRLRELAARLHKTFDVDAQALPANLADAAELARVEDTLRSGGIDVLINNAGFGANVPFVDLPSDRAEEMLRVKVIAPTRLARAALPPMVAKGSGTVINVASLLAFSGALQMPQLPLSYLCRRQRLPRCVQPTPACRSRRQGRSDSGSVSVVGKNRLPPDTKSRHFRHS